MIGIVYCAQNLINQKRYIGQTTQSLNKRIRGHKDKAIKKGNKTYFHNALRKYEIDNFMWTILCYTSNQKALNKAETYWIKYYHTMEDGYNHREGGANGKFSETAKRKLSRVHIGKKLSEETKSKLSKIATGRRHSLEAKRKMRENNSHTKRIFTKETRLKLSAAAKRQWADPESREKSSISMKKAWIKRIIGYISPMRGKTHSEKSKKKISDTLKGRKIPEETKNRIGIASKRRWADPEYREKAVKAMRKNK